MNYTIYIQIKLNTVRVDTEQLCKVASQEKI